MVTALTYHLCRKALWLHPPLSTEMCSQPGSTGAELMVRTHNLKTRVFTAETGENIDHCTSSTTAICLHGTHGIALIQHPNEACYISSRIRVGTNNHFKHSTTVFATPARNDNHSTVSLCLAEHAVCLYKLHACILYMPRALFGFTGGLHDWNLAFVLQR